MYVGGVDRGNSSEVHGRDSGQNSATHGRDGKQWKPCWTVFLSTAAVTQTLTGHLCSHIMVALIVVSGSCEEVV
jgi:hypothetical protein